MRDGAARVIAGQVSWQVQRAVMKPKPICWDSSIFISPATTRWEWSTSSRKSYAFDTRQHGKILREPDLQPPGIRQSPRRNVQKNIETF